MEEDEEVRMIEQRKLEALKRKAAAAKPLQPASQKSDREVVSGILYDRGDEVLDAAYSAYPVQTAQLVGEVATMVRSGRLKERVSGGELYSLFREVGLRFRLNTSIKVQVKGKMVDLSEKLKMKKEEE